MNLEKIKQKLDNLEVVKRELKVKFIGIDNIIDEFINNVKIWYACPELQMRPFILNLWGMTGVGKTDLVRTFVKLINFNDRFIELQMDNLNNEGSYGEKTIQSHLELVLDGTDEECILLLDEMQRFKTIDEGGSDLPKSESDKYSDIWSLLSDGKFTNDASYKKRLMEYYFNMLYDIEERKTSKKNNAINKNKKKSMDKEVDDEASCEEKGVYKTQYWDANRLKKILKLTESVEVIMRWDVNKILSIVETALKSTSTRETPIYKKMLIIISGNLDEAYNMARETDSTDIDADVYHEYSKKITILDVKEALSSRFKPEQIARFGNVHLIYPSLDKKTYQTIIKNKCIEISKNVKTNTNIVVNYDDSVYDVIYRNGVFPTQGVRPLLSTISALLENSLPYFIYMSLKDLVNEIKIYAEDDILYIINNDKKIDYRINLVIDNIKKENNYNIECNVAVHEVGHAIIYMELFNLVPVQLMCNSASSYTNGFLMPHMLKKSKKSILSEIVLSMAGVVAEEIIFGDDYKGVGGKGDIMKATGLASSFVREFGMEGYDSHIITSTIKEFGASYGVLNQIESSESIEKIIKDCKTKAYDIIHKKLSLLKKLTLTLLKEKTMKPEDIFKISKKYYTCLSVKDSSHKVTENYEDIMLKKFQEIN